MNRRARAILWLDGGGAAVAGVVVLVTREWLASLHRFPLALVVAIGVVNLVYASYSGTLAARASSGRAPSRRAIDVLVTANLAWTVVCATIVAARWETASLWGILHVGVEGSYVAGLAVAERRLVRPFAA